MDWEAIEREFRAGQLTLDEIARMHGCSRTAIQKHAKRKGWTRDLTARVRQRTASKIVQNISPLAAVGLSESEIVEAAAERGHTVVKGHLARADRLKKLADRMAYGLELWTGIAEGMQGKHTVPDFPLFVAKSDGPASLLRTLADVTERITKIERTALNLDSAPTEEDEILIEIG